MRALIRLTAASLLVAFVIATGAVADHKDKEAEKRSKDEERTRGLFLNKKADAMRVVILKSEGGAMVPVDPSTEFTEGDEIKLSFQSNFQGYVYIVNVTPGGKKCVLFPYKSEADNTVRPDRRYDLPQDATIAFDAEKGTEVLQVIMSPSRIEHLDAAIKEAGGCLAESASSAAAELASERGGIVKSNITAVIPKSALRSRNIVLAAGKDKDQNGSVVAISNKDGASKLKDGEAAVFEIKLKHN